MEYKVLNINGAVLDKAHLEQYLEKLASDHVIINKSKKETYPMQALIENKKKRPCKKRAGAPKIVDRRMKE